ncbi:MAG: hypothetical protein COA79_24880 [Planctomycetota bacterium]|nr:MAG: hypothetical protein COA79_24880 [Planctomycetota bacterium]
MKQTVFLLFFAFISLPTFTNEYKATPKNYRNLASKLKSGDILVLEAGQYKNDFSLRDIHGKEGSPIIIKGVSGKTVFMATKGENTFNISQCSYIHFKNITFKGNRRNVDAIKISGKPSHHLLFENNVIKNYGDNQQIVGFSTKATVWNITIRGNVIDGAGTGMYLGNSDGSMPFINGIVENNLIMNTIGYNIEIKHQNKRPGGPGIPITGKTIIRYNVFSKHSKRKGKSDGARPNLLVGHFPESGNGSKDEYHIYNNFFYQNVSNEYLFQGEGNIFFFNNVMYNSKGGGINIMKQNGKPKSIRVYYNTVVSKGRSIRISRGDSNFKQIAFGNAAFSDANMRVAKEFSNIVGSFKDADKYLKLPSGDLGELDLSPKTGKLKGKKINIDDAEKLVDSKHDFEGVLRKHVYVGAYAGSSKDGIWSLSLKRMNVKDIYDVLAGKDKTLKRIVKRIHKGGKYSSLLAELNRLKTSKPVAEQIATELVNEGILALNKAEDIEDENPVEAYRIYSKLVILYGTTEVAKVAKDNRKLIKSEVIKIKKIRSIKERKAKILYLKVEKAVKRLKPFKGERNAENANFRKLNSNAIKNIIRACEIILTKYDGTESTMNAIDLLKEFKIADKK